MPVLEVSLFLFKPLFLEFLNLPKLLTLNSEGFRLNEKNFREISV